MFPLKDANPLHGPSIIMWVFVAANIIIFLFQLTLAEAQLWRFITHYGFIPAAFFANPLAEGFSLLSSMFLHGSIAHILGNMFFLFVFGDNVEDRMGHGRFTVFYLLAGVAATLIHGLFDRGSSIPMIGASGAISAILGAYIVLFPHQKVLTIIPPLIVPWLLVRLFGNVPRFFLPWLPAWIYIGYWALIQFFEATNDLMTPQANVAGVAWWAHVGGFVFGVLTVRFFVKPKVSL